MTAWEYDWDKSAEDTAWDYDEWDESAGDTWEDDEIKDQFEGERGEGNSQFSCREKEGNFFRILNSSINQFFFFVSFLFV